MGALMRTRPQESDDARRHFLLPPPALREHSRGSACGPHGGRRPRPHPRLPHRRGVGLEDAADDDAIRDHVEVVLLPLAGGPRGIRALKDQLGHTLREDMGLAAARARCRVR
jgi:hypothetical protein